MKKIRFGVVAAAVLAVTLSTAACSNDTPSGAAGDTTSASTVTDGPTTATTTRTRLLAPARPSLTSSEPRWTTSSPR